MLTPDSPEVLAFLTAWHENGRAEFERSYDALHYDTYAVKTAKDRKRFLALDRDQSGVFLVDRETHELYSIKGYGRANRRLGTLEAVTRVYEQATAQQKTVGAVGYLGEDTRIAQAAVFQEAP